MKAQDLKRSILQLAIQGKLVPQNPSDEPASELLKKIKAEKAELVKQGKSRKISKKATSTKALITTIMRRLALKSKILQTKFHLKFLKIGNG